MSRLDIGLAALAGLFIFMFFCVVWQRDRAQRLGRLAIEGRDHWKRNYDIVEERLVRMERALRLRVQLNAEDRASPAFARIEAEIKRLIPAADRRASDTPWLDLAREGSELAFNFKRGCVAPDGTIWIASNQRAAKGVVLVVEGERAKAERFGWVWQGVDPDTEYDIMERR